MSLKTKIKNVAESILKPPPHGIKNYLTDEGIRVIRIHYTADPLKDPKREGAEWFKRELQGYKGVEDPRWRKEMEIDFDAHGGQLLFPYLLGESYKVICKPFDPRAFTMIAGLDYGTRNPSAFIVLAIDFDGNPYVVWEYYEPKRGKLETEAQFRKRKGYKALSKAIKACPYFLDKDGNTFIDAIYADPSLWTKNQEKKDGLKSVADLFAEEEVYLSRGNRGGDYACYERISSDYWQDLDKPRLKIFPNIKWLLFEMERLRFQDFSDTVQLSKNLNEKIVDKDNHAWDAVKYVLMAKPTATDRPKKSIPKSTARINRLESRQHDTYDFEAELDSEVAMAHIGMVDKSGYGAGENDRDMLDGLLDDEDEGGGDMVETIEGG